MVDEVGDTNFLTVLTSRLLYPVYGMITEEMQQPFRQVDPDGHDMGSTPPGPHAMTPVGHMGGGGGAPDPPVPPPLLVPAQ